MNQTIQRRNAIVRWIVIVILAADLILLGVTWRLNVSPHVQAGDLRRLEILEKSYRADNARLERFRHELPADEKDWDSFFTRTFILPGPDIRRSARTWENSPVPRDCIRTRLHSTSTLQTRAA